MARLHRAAHHDPIVARAFNEVVNLLAPPQSLMRSAILWRVLRGNLSNSHPTHASTRGHSAELSSLDENR